MLKKGLGQRYKDIFFIVIGIWITCNRSNSNINFMLVLRVKWKKCSIIICRGSRLGGGGERWIYPIIIIIICGCLFTTFVFAVKQVQFLKKAVDILCQCRQTLMYTYVFAYYLRKNNQSVIFEDNQKDLESATEKLSEFLERDITSENLADIKQKVQDKYRYGKDYPLGLSNVIVVN